MSLSLKGLIEAHTLGADSGSGGGSGGVGAAIMTSPWGLGLALISHPDSALRPPSLVALLYRLSMTNGQGDQDHRTASQCIHCFTIPPHELRLGRFGRWLCWTGCPREHRQRLAGSCGRVKGAVSGLGPQGWSVSPQGRSRRCEPDQEAVHTSPHLIACSPVRKGRLRCLHAIVGCPCCGGFWRPPWPKGRLESRAASQPTWAYSYEG